MIWLALVVTDAALLLVALEATAWVDGLRPHWRAWCGLEVREVGPRPVLVTVWTVGIWLDRLQAVAVGLVAGTVSWALAGLWRAVLGW